MKENPGKYSLHQHARKLVLFIRHPRRRTFRFCCVAVLLVVLTLPAVHYYYYYRRGRRDLPSSSRRPHPKKRGPNFCDIDIGYQNQHELQGRQYRFPSVQDRIQVYMSNWYKIPCNNDTLAVTRETSPEGRQVYYVIKEKDMSHHNAADPRLFRMDSKVAPARMFYGHQPSIATCAADENPRKRAMRNYCRDVNQTILPLVDKNAWNKNGREILAFRGIPIMFQFGDATQAKAPDATGQTLLQQPRIPYLKKFRLSMDRTELDVITRDDEQWTRQEQEQSCQFKVPQTIKGVRDDGLQPIVWKLNIPRHFGQLHLVPCNDVPWEEKMDRAIFRGNLNGYLEDDDNNDGVVASQNAMEKCLALPRCRLTWEYRHSKMVDARLRSTMDIVPDVIGGFNLTADPMPMRNMTSYKGIVILEGNDVSSGLKWAMLSSSVVLMAKPLFTSWAMEELLEPWIHYIPIESDFSDLEEKVAWMIHHDAESRRISYRASLWIKDLVFHPSVADDEQQIFRQILERYARHFAI